MVVVVVECYCFLINIIDENIETLPLLPRSISVQKAMVLHDAAVKSLNTCKNFSKR